MRNVSKLLCSYVKRENQVVLAHPFRIVPDAITPLFLYNCPQDQQQHIHNSRHL